MLALQALRHDLGYAWRSLLGTPQFTIAALLSLAISIGANTAVFSVANALLLRPLVYPEANRLMILWNRSPGLGISQDWFSTAQYFDIRASHTGFEQVAIAIGANYNLTGTGDPEVPRYDVKTKPLLLRASIGSCFTWNRATDPLACPKSR